MLLVEDCEERVLRCSVWLFSQLGVLFVLLSALSLPDSLVFITLGHCSLMFGSGSPPAPDSALSDKLKLCPEGMVHDLNNLIFNFVFPPARTRSSGTILPQRRKLQPDPSSASVQESNPTDQIQHSQAQSPAQPKQSL